MTTNLTPGRVTQATPPLTVEKTPTKPIKQLGRKVTNTHKTWVQTERAAHEAWSRLVMREAKAAALLHTLIAHMGPRNALVISRPTLAKLMGVSVATVKRATEVLKAERWIEVVQLGGKGGTNAYVVNCRVAWGESRKNLHFAVFDATVVADISEQNAPLMHDQLRSIPTLYPGEQNTPRGEDRLIQPDLEDIDESELQQLHESSEN